jgi:hypothetical protein
LNGGRRRGPATAALAMLAALVATSGPMAWPARGAGADAPDFDALWAIAKRWAAESNAAPEDCVFTLRFDGQTRRLRSGYSATCEEPYRSPFYPWPEPSKPGIRFSADDVERYGRDAGPGARASGRPGGDPAAAIESCDLVVGFTPDGRSAEAVECYRRVGNVIGQRANTEFFVKAPDGRQVVSRLYERMGHLGDPAIRKKGTATQPAPTPVAKEVAGPGEAILQVDGKVVAREAERLKIRGRALPLFGGSSADPGVVTTDANIVVQYPSDDALRPGYYFGGEHCFKEKGDAVNAEGQRITEWIYGPCALGPDQYWVFETHPPGNRTLSFGPYRDYGQCDGDRKKAKANRMGVAGHCLRRAKVLFRMTQDGTLVVPPNAPPID